PHLVESHSFGDDNGRPYLVMEYVPGRTLNDYLDGTPLEPHAAARLLGSLAIAVQHAHHAGIVHRDLKPANILMSGERSRSRTTSATTRHSSLATSKITDFG